jgi:hypothetical protein
MICRTFSCAVPYSSASCRLRQGTALRAAPDSDAGGGTAADGDAGRTHAHGTGNGRSGDDVAYVSTRLVPLAEDSCVSRSLGTSG